MVGYLNIQGINTKFDQLQILMSSNKIDIFGISETKLNDTHITETFSVNGYQRPLRRDRNENRGGGILVYVKDGINCIRREDLESPDLENVWIEIKQPNSKSILICMLYRHPEAKVSWKDVFENNIENAQCDDKEIIVLGDFNKDLLNGQINKDWINYTSSLGFTQMIKSATREFNNSGTLIDHVYTDNPQNIIWTSVPKLSLSDHYPIFCSRKVNTKNTKKSHLTIKYRSFKNFNEENFLSDLNNINWNTLHTISDVNETLKVFMDSFVSVIDKHVPVRNHRVKRPSQPEWLNEEIIDAMKARDKFKARNDMDNYRLFRNKVSNLINTAKRRLYEKKINQGQNNPSTIWKLFKEFRSPGSAKSSVNSLNIDGKEIINSQKISDEFNTFFTSIASNLKETVPPSEFKDIHSYVNSKVPLPMYFNIPLIDRDKVRKMLINLDISKSTGLDDLGPRFLKIAANIIYPVIHHIINLTISQSTFPDVWKTAKVTPLFKAGSKSDVNNYRPISILPTLSKIVEKHVHDSLMQYLNHYKLLVKTQSGFRQNHSCETALVHLIDKWLKAINDGFIIGVVMVDFRKAFDLVDHSILLKKLELYKCSHTTINWFKSYLGDRKQRVSLNGFMSSEKNIEYGVPQGSILGPLLFLIFINDLPFSLHNVISSTDMYADDTTICDVQRSVGTLQANLQSSLALLETWCRNNGMVLNTDKTKVLLITTPHKRARLNVPFSLTFKNIPLKSSKSEKLLGVYVNENLKWDDHVNKIKKKISTNLWLLSRIKMFIPLSARILFYKAYIQPHLDFCNVIWGGTNNTNLHKLYVLQKRLCKTIFGKNYTSVPNSMEAMSCLSIHERIIVNKAKFMYKVSKESIPCYVVNMFENDQRVYTNLRSASSLNYAIPRPKMELFKQSISYSGPCIWNKIPESIRCMKTLDSFTTHLIRWLKSINN